MKETSTSSPGWKLVVIGLLIALGIFFLGWDSGPCPREVYVDVMPYNEPSHDFNYHLVPYHEGMTIRDAVNAAIQKRALPSVKEPEMELIVDRHLVWTWRAACQRPLDALTSLMEKMGWQVTVARIQIWQMRHDLLGNSHVQRVDDQHSHWNSEARPNEFIHVRAQHPPAQPNPTAAP